MMQRMYKEERDKAIAQLKMLAVKHELDIDSLLLSYRLQSAICC